MQDEEYPYTIKIGREVYDYIKSVSQKTGLDTREVVLQIFGWYKYSFEKQEEGFRVKFVKTEKIISFLGLTVSRDKSVHTELLGKVSTLDELIGEIEASDESSSD